MKPLPPSPQSSYPILVGFIGISIVCLCICGYMYSCIYVYMYICICVYLCICIYVCMSICIYIWTFGRLLITYSRYIWGEPRNAMQYHCAINHSVMLMSRPRQVHTDKTTHANNHTSAIVHVFGSQYDTSIYIYRFSVFCFLRGVANPHPIAFQYVEMHSFSHTHPLKAIVQELQLRALSLETLASELSLKNFSLGSLAWDLQLSDLQLSDLQLWDLWRQLENFSFRYFSLGSLAWDLQLSDLQLCNFYICKCSFGICSSKSLACDPQLRIFSFEIFGFSLRTSAQDLQLGSFSLGSLALGTLAQGL